MSGAKFGPLYTDMEDVIDPVSFAVDAEAWGYQSVWMVDFMLHPCYDPFVSLAAIAQRTRHLELGTAVAVVPYKEPVHLAKLAASLHALSGGRFHLGVGLGANRAEFDAMRADMRERGRLTDERLALVRRLLAEDEVTHCGRFHRLEKARVGPKPRGERPSVRLWNGPIWREGFVDNVLRRTALYCDGFLPTRAPAAACREAKERIGALALETGRDPQGLSWGALVWFRIGEDRELALRRLNEEMASRSGFSNPMAMAQGNALGAPEQCAADLQAYLDAGVTHFVVDAGCEPGRMAEQYQRFAEEVIPLLQPVVVGDEHLVGGINASPRR